MKKKLLALLLASSMALMNVAPAYGTDIFTDPDNAANEDVISVPEELDNNGEFNDTEDEFTSEQTDDDFFSDEKEMPSVQEGDTLVANAGQGITRADHHSGLLRHERHHRRRRPGQGRHRLRLLPV